MPYTSKVSSPGISVDTNNDGTINGRIHRIRNAGNFNTFSIANGVLTVQGPTGGSSIGGSDTHVQFNDGGSMGGESTMAYNKTSNTLTVSNLTVSGELIVTTTTTLNSNTVNIGDNIIVLNSDATGSASADAGIEIERGDDANVQFLWDESEDSWDFDTYNLASVGRIYAAGSTTPVYSFTSDTNTGIEHAGGDELGLMVNGIRRVHIGVNGMSIVGLDGSTAASAAGSNQALLVDDISIDTQTIATTGSNKNLLLAPHGSGSVELGGASSNATSITTTASAHATVGTSLTISAGSTTAGTTNNIAGGSLTLSAGQGKGTGAGGDIVFKTANAGSSASTINALATALTISDDLSAAFTGAVTVAGNLTVSGTTTQVNTTNTAVADQLLVINDGESQNGVDNGSGLAGVEVDRGADGGTPNDHAFFVFNEDGDTWNARVGTSPTGLVASALNLSGLTASNIVITDGSKNLVSAATGTYPSLTELAYVKGVTSAVQTQLDAKQATITGSATTIDTESLTASRAVISNGSQKIAVSATTSTELGYVNGVTSAIQTQLGTKEQVGKRTIWVPAAAMYPNTTNGCSALTQVELSNGPELKVLDFDDGSDEFAQFTVAFPKSWNEGTVTFQPFWTISATGTNTVAWQLSAIAFGNDDDINLAFGTPVATSAHAHSGTSGDMMMSPESGPVTITGAGVDSVTYFQINRDTSADNHTSDARLVGVKVFYTTDKVNDGL